jgi:hypothetical protein
MSRALDRQRDYAQIYGAENGAVYEQDGLSFDAQGRELRVSVGADAVIVDPTQTPIPETAPGQPVDTPVDTAPAKAKAKPQRGRSLDDIGGDA